MISHQLRAVLQLIADKRLDAVDEGDEHFEAVRDLLEAGYVTGADAGADDGDCYLRLRITFRGKDLLAEQQGA